MSDLRASNFRGRTTGSVPDFPDGATVVSGISTLDSQGVRVAGIVTATSFTGALTGNADSATSATTATNASGLTGTPSISVVNIDGSGCLLYTSPSPRD